jgi:hypothetical protein
MCKGVVYDSQGNLYALNGPATLTKVNADGALVWDFPLPVQDETAVVRAIALDPLTDRLYVGVSEGGSQSGAWIRCYEPDRDKKLALVWDVRPGGYTEWLVITGDKLYAAQNFPDAARSKYTVYEDIASEDRPKVAFEKVDIPYPVHDLDVKASGDVFTASAPRTGLNTDQRFYDPRTPKNTMILDDQPWNPTMLPNWDLQKWAWFRARDITGYDDGDDLLEWRDTRGRGLCTFKKDVTKATYKTPRYKAHGLGYKPTVQFDGTNYRMRSDASVGITENLNDVQPTLFPGKGRGYAIVMVIQGSEDATAIGRLFAQVNNASGSSGIRECYINADADGTPPGAATQGAISISNLRLTAAAGSTNPQAAGTYGKFNNKCGAAIISIVCDNEATASAESVFRVNGVPVARFDAYDFFTNAGLFSYLGCKDDGTLGPTVGISEILVLQSYTDPADGVHKLLSFPFINATAGSGTHDVSTSDTDLERVEGYFAIEYGISDLLDRGNQSGTTIVWDDEGGASAYGHPYSNHEDAVDTTPVVNPRGRDADNFYLAILSNIGVTAKWSAQRGNVRWAYQGAAMGYAVKVAGEDTVYTCGPRTNSASSGTSAAGLRALNDNGSAASFRWFYVFTDGSGLGVDYSYEYPRLTVDTFENLWAPFHAENAGTKYSVLGFRPNGGGTPFLLYALNAGTALACHAVAVSPRLPDYSTNPTTITRPEFIALGSENGGDATISTLHSVRTVDAVNNDASPRSVVNLAVANGNIKTFSSNDTVATVGSGVLDSTARWVSACVAFNKVFFADGETYQVFDPKTGAVTAWAAEDGGAMLPRYRLLCLWRGRMVLARGPDTPFNWQMSEYGNPNGWDLFPPDAPLATQAVNGQEHEMGEVPDIINTLIPYDRERLVFGCDHTIYCMWGDPMENGSIVLLSDVTGMAFGSPWARDSDDNLYFFGSRGGIFQMTPGFSVRKLSSETIDRRLRDVDLASYHVALVWDDELQELRIYQTPQGAGGTIVPSWAWSKRTNSWHQDRTSVADVQATCVAVFDGDAPDDRVCVFGCEDGFVRKVDKAAKGDSGYTIHAYTTWWPIATGTDATRLRNVKVTLASELDGARLELFASGTPDDMGQSKASYDLSPGQNPRFLQGVKGAYVGLKISNAAPGQAFAYESGSAEAYGAGRKVATA